MLDWFTRFNLHIPINGVNLGHVPNDFCEWRKATQKSNGTTIQQICAMCLKMKK